jgi:hypothetical protein
MVLTSCSVGKDRGTQRAKVGHVDSGHPTSRLKLHQVRMVYILNCSACLLEGNPVDLWERPKCKNIPPRTGQTLAANKRYIDA